MALSQEVLVNDFALRTFRDVGDEDYIAARSSYKSGLWSPFLWSSLQALEKYLKGLLLLERVPAKRCGHDLAKLLAKAEQLPYGFQLSARSQSWVTDLGGVGRWRYLEVSYVVDHMDLVGLDRAVCEVRNWYSHERRAAPPDNDIEKPSWRKVPGGFLEAVMDDPKHRARPALVWRNLYFSSRSRRKVRLARFWRATNAPLSLKPQILDEVTRYVHIPKEIEKAYRALAEEKDESG